jgi:hypothetical protein
MKSPQTIVLDDHLIDVLESACVAECEWLGQIAAKNRDWPEVVLQATRVLKFIAIIEKYRASSPKKVTKKPRK